MPSKAGRVRMPPDNRLPVSASLKTSDIWKNSVGYDPYASVEEISKRELKKKEETNEEINEKAKSLFSLARLTGTASATIPGACTLCNHIGHLPYQCRNLISLEKLNFQNDIKEEAEDDLKERRNLGIVSDSDSSEGSSDDGRDSEDSERETKKKKKRKHKRKREKRRDKRERRSRKEERRPHDEEKRSRKHAKRRDKDKAERRRHSSRDRNKPNVKKKEKRKRRRSETDNEGVREKRHRGRSSSIT